jgi:hypothetical protein
MDFVNKLAGGNNNEEQKPSSSQQKSEGGFLGGIGDKINSAAGGGRESEKNEDMLDKGPSYQHPFWHHEMDSILAGVDFVQEKFLGQGPQDNEACDVSIHVYIETCLHQNSLPLNKPRTSRLATTSASSTRGPLAPTFPSPTKRPSLVDSHLIIIQQITLQLHNKPLFA